MVARDSRLMLTGIIIIPLLLAYALPGLAAQSLAATGVAVVSGSCTVSGRGALYVFLVDERTFSAPLMGVQATKMEVDTRPGAKESFTFSFRVPRGLYGLRCYLDENGNGKLDRGLLGPTEPWGMSWQGARPIGIPSFADISFQVDGNIDYPALALE